MQIGKKLRAWRLSRGVTQTEAAEAAGISQSSWAEIEVGDFKRIGHDVVLRIVEVTGGEISINDFPRPRGKKVKPIPPPESGTDISASTSKAS